MIASFKNESLAVQKYKYLSFLFTKKALCNILMLSPFCYLKELISRNRYKTKTSCHIPFIPKHETTEEDKYRRE